MIDTTYVRVIHEMSSELNVKKINILLAILGIMIHVT